MHFCDTSAKKNPLIATSAGVTAPTLASSAASHSEMPAMSRARPQRAADAARPRRRGHRSADTNAALADPEIKEKLAQSGYVAGGSSPEELEKLLKSEIAKWSAVIKSVGIKID